MSWGWATVSNTSRRSGRMPGARGPWRCPPTSCRRRRSVRIPALVADDVTLTDSHSICDYIDGRFGNHRLLAADGPERWRALEINALACAILEAQIMRRAEVVAHRGRPLRRFHRQDARSRAALLRGAGDENVVVRRHFRAWRRSRRPSPAATTNGATGRAGARQPRSSPPGTTPRRNAPR